MATLPTKQALYSNIVLKCYLRGYLTSCAKYCSSKDKSDVNLSKPDLNQNNGKQNEEKPTDEKLKFSETKSPEEQKKEAAKKKLFSLLSELKVSSDQSRIKPDLVLSKPLKRITKKERFADILQEKKSPDEKIIQAVNAAAESVGGDALETQKELKEKLSSLNLIAEDSQQDEKVVSDDLGISENVQEEIISSIKDVASTVPTPVRSKLTQRLLKLSIEKRDEKQAKISMKNMMEGLTIEKRVDVSKKPPVPDVRLKERRMAPKSRGPSEIRIFQSPPLGIFSIEDVTKEEPKETVWEKLERKKLKLLTEFAPANAFEEMIMWTEQGKHWKFPIDNEAEMGEEENVGFHEHVFLEKHLHGFPTKGPIRLFMELVTVGLSKNPYITVERKIENIDWFRNYFKEKEDVLKQCGVLG